MIRFEDLIEKVRATNPDADVELLRRAYVFSAYEHKGQVRHSGEPYLVHPLEVADLLADMKLDVVAVAAGLLHDIVEDTQTPIERIQDLFGKDIAHVVVAIFQGTGQVGVPRAHRRDLLADVARLDAHAVLPVIPDAIAQVTRPKPELLKYYALRAIATTFAFPLTMLLLYFRYHTMRYRFDFAPFMTMAALVGYRAISLTAAEKPESWRERLRIAAVGLCALGILGSHYVLLIHKVWSIAVPMPVRLALLPFAPFARAAFEP